MAEQPAGTAKVETRDVHPGILWLTGIGLALIVIASATGLLIFFSPDAAWRFHRLAKPEPVLQVSPIEDYEGFIVRKRAELQDRGRADRAAGLVEIPIDEAMRLVSEGHRAEAEIDDAGCDGAACAGATPTARTIP